MIRLETKNYNTILTEKQQKCHHYINKEAAKILALLSGKNEKYEFLADKEILPSDQRRIIGQAKFTHAPFGKKSI